MSSSTKAKLFSKLTPLKTASPTLHLSFYLLHSADVKVPTVHFLSRFFLPTAVDELFRARTRYRRAFYLGDNEVAQTGQRYRYFTASVFSRAHYMQIWAWRRQNSLPFDLSRTFEQKVSCSEKLHIRKQSFSSLFRQFQVQKAEDFRIREKLLLSELVIFSSTENSVKFCSW